MANEKALKAKFHEAVEKAKADGLYDPKTYTTEMLWALRDMAKADVWPDGSFGDNDCNVWSMFHCFQREKR